MISERVAEAATNPLENYHTAHPIIRLKMGYFARNSRGIYAY
jgi:hypothetical protein